MDKKILKLNGITAGNYKKIFTASVLPTKTAKLVELIAGRLQEARRMNLRDYRLYWAIDLAHEVPFNQTAPTLIQSFLSRNWKTADEAYKALESWGLSEKQLFVDTVTPDGQKAKALNPPVFFQILVPLVKAYSTIRLAKIYNERDTSPLLTFNPSKNTARNRVMCEVVEDIADTISTGLGYPAVLREAIQQMLKYGVSISFPREAWYSDRQDTWDDAEQKSKTVTVKEGLRYVFPHPSRMAYDLTFSASTFNTNSGCSWALYWHVIKYGEILDSEYWNRDNIFFGTNWLNEPMAQNFFQEVFPCQLKFPEFNGEAASMTRENKAAYYSGKTHRDKALFVTEYFMLLKPSQWGLGEYSDSNLKKLKSTYDKPVWHRFVIAGDDCVIYCEPLPYTPNWFMGYDYDPQAARTSSLSLELIPWQDQIGNQLSQLILTAKQNLANVTFYDKNVVDTGAIDKLEASGNSRYTGMNFIPLDSFKMQRQGLGADKALFPMRLEKQPIQEQLQMINLTLNIMERVLQITAQEAGAAASHQQSKAEVLQTGGASSNRLSFTSSFVDDAIDAWKRQIFEAYQAYGDADIAAEVSRHIATEEDLNKILDELGFRITGKTSDGAKMFVAGKKKSLQPLRFETFARSNEGPQSLKNPELAQAITTAVGMIASNETLSKEVGAKKIITLLEWVVEIGSGIRGTKLAGDEPSKDTEVPANVMEAINAAIGAAMKTVEQKVALPLAEANSAEDAKISQIEGVIQQLQGIYKIAEATQQKAAIQQQEAQAKIQIQQAIAAKDQERKNADAAAEQARKDAEAQAEIQRKDAIAAAEVKRVNEAHQAELQRQADAARVDAAIAVSESEARTELAKKEAASKPKQPPKQP